MTDRFCFTETRILSGASRIVARATVPLHHTKQAARVFCELHESLRQSGLRGKVRVTVGGEDKAVAVENGKLVILF